MRDRQYTAILRPTPRLAAIRHYGLIANWARGNVNVRRSIAGHPNLPPERLGELLRDPDDGIAERAASNTSLPPEAMHRLLDQLDVPDLESAPSR